MLDGADSEWPRDDGAILIWDSTLDFKVLFHFPERSCLSKYQAYESELGLISVSWSPCGKFLAVGTNDHMLQVLNDIESPCFAAILKHADCPLGLGHARFHSSTDRYMY